MPYHYPHTFDHLYSSNKVVHSTQVISYKLQWLRSRFAASGEDATLRMSYESTTSGSPVGTPMLATVSLSVLISHIYNTTISKYVAFVSTIVQSTAMIPYGVNVSKSQSKPGVLYRPSPDCAVHL